MHQEGILRRERQETAAARLRVVRRGTRYTLRLVLGLAYQQGSLRRERQETAAARLRVFRRGTRYSLRFKVLRTSKGFCVGSAKKRPLLGLGYSAGGLDTRCFRFRSCVPARDSA